MYNVAIIGYGGIARVHEASYRELESAGKAKLVAVFTKDASSFDEKKDINISSDDGTKSDFHRYTNLDEMLLNRKETVWAGNILMAQYMPEVIFEGDMLKIKHTTKSYNVQLNKNNDCNITITVPKGTELGSVEITTDLGNVEIKDSMSFDKLEVTASLGNIEVESVKAAEIDIEADLGNVEIRKCDIDNINIKADLGDVSVKRCNFGTGDITNDLGAIEIDGEFNSLIASCSMGELDVKCDNISGAHMDLSADLGVVMVNGKSKGGSYRQ